MKGWDVRRMSGSEDTVRCPQHQRERCGQGLGFLEGVEMGIEKSSTLARPVSSSACVAASKRSATWTTARLPLRGQERRRVP